MKSADALNRLLEESSISSGSEAARRLTFYLALLEKWNSRINLTSTTDWSVIGPMFREAIWASSLYPSEAIAHLDIGSGAGFPALLLKLLIPRIDLELVDSCGKKMQFLETVVQALGIPGVRAHHASLSDHLRKSSRKRWDCISWKALKLSSDDLLQVHAHSHPDTQVWIFHGKTLALVEPKAIGQRFELLRTERVPGTRESRLSIYCPIP
jgi:16S rRNA (guanine(527)-N(7))-methyltransferase RsmG